MFDPTFQGNIKIILKRSTNREASFYKIIHVQMYIDGEECLVTKYMEFEDSENYSYEKVNSLLDITENSKTFFHKFICRLFTFSSCP